MNKIFVMILPLLVTVFFTACQSADVQAQLDAMKVRQDSIIFKLKQIEDQTRFIALKVGWEPPEDTMPVAIPQGTSYFQGAKNPVLTLVEFSDIQCPYCARLSPIVDSIVKAYPNDVKVIFKHFPLSFHAQAMSAHAAILAAGKQGKFFEYRYGIAPHFRNLNDSTYIALAKNLGLNLEKFKKDMVLTEDIKNLILQDQILGQKVRVSGTPTLFGNGKKVQNLSFEGIASLVLSLKK